MNAPPGSTATAGQGPDLPLPGAHPVPGTQKRPVWARSGTFDPRGARRGINVQASTGRCRHRVPSYRGAASLPAPPARPRRCAGAPGHCPAQASAGTPHGPRLTGHEPRPLCSPQSGCRRPHTRSGCLRTGLRTIRRRLASTAGGHRSSRQAPPAVSGQLWIPPLFPLPGSSLLIVVPGGVDDQVCALGASVARWDSYYGWRSLCSTPGRTRRWRPAD